MTMITDRLFALREAMKAAGLQAFIIPTEDPHMSEYPAACWKNREWITGFTGSFGTAVVTLDNAGLWTDSRYFLQAEAQLAGTGIDLYRLKIAGTPSIPQFLISNLKPGDKVGVDGRTISIAQADEMRKVLAAHDINLDTSVSLIDRIWTDRPVLPDSAVWEMPVERSGRSAAEKIALINKSLADTGADATVLSALDDVAWTFNIRALDVAYNPVAVAYGFVSPQRSVLFIDEWKVSPEIAERLKAQGVELMPYDSLVSFLHGLPEEIKVLLDKARTNTSIADALPEGASVVDSISPANHFKSLKSEAEIEGFRSATLKDGIAMTRFFKWLEESLARGERVTELSAARKLASFRAEQPGYICDSFAPISSYGPHGAVVHYTPTPESDVELHRDSLYLIDSGGQYSDGTTDITRTIALLSEPTARMRSDFTAALRGTIGIALAHFPAGIRGCLIDAFARKYLWEAGIQYLHGTCHGIGHCLNVHEGPQSIRMEENPVVIEPGMVMSDEPAMYRPGQYGIRTENMVLCREVQTTEFGTFLGFETLTLCYIDMSLVDLSVMTAPEINWLKNYQRHVFETLSPHLSEEEREWLRKKTEV